MKTLKDLLSGNDLRSIGNVDEVINLITDQQSFDNLFSCLFSNNRIIVMRTADAIEKITAKHQEYLFKHKEELLYLLTIAENKELKWHLALLLSRLELTKKEVEIVKDKLIAWALNKKESRIVRVNSLQTLYDLSRKNLIPQNNFVQILKELEHENIPSITARIKKFKI